MQGQHVKNVGKAKPAIATAVKPTWDTESIRSKLPKEAQKAFQMILDDAESRTSLSAQVEIYLKKRPLEEKSNSETKPHKVLDILEQATGCLEKFIKLLNELPSGFYLQLVESFIAEEGQKKLRKQTGSKAQFKKVDELLNEFDSRYPRNEEQTKKDKIDRRRIIANWFCPIIKEGTPGLHPRKQIELRDLHVLLLHTRVEIMTNRSFLISLLNMRESSDQLLIAGIFDILMLIDPSRGNRALDIARAFNHEALGYPPPLDWERSFFAKLKKDSDKFKGYSLLKQEIKVFDPETVADNHGVQGDSTVAEEAIEGKSGQSRAIQGNQGKSREIQGTKSPCHTCIEKRKKSKKNT
jgi:hypothetical protein